MYPVIAIIGRPNVGKSTLFNCLTKQRDAIVADSPGVTRDRLYGHINFAGRRFVAIDTGGIGDEEVMIDQSVEQQAECAIEEADALLLVVDAQSGVTSADEAIANRLRQVDKPIYVLANKSESIEYEVAKTDFYSLGFERIVPTSAAHQFGMSEFMQSLCEILPETLMPITEIEQETERNDINGEERHRSPVRIAIVGKPNVGKSTLVNRLLGEDRVIVYDEPGTTRDSILVPFEHKGENYALIDTAGIRRRSKINDTLEKFSVVKSLQSIDACQVAIMVIDAREGVSDQDLRLLNYIVDAGKAMVIAVNKWDSIESPQRQRVHDDLEEKLSFVHYIEKHCTSALNGTNIECLFDSLLVAYSNATRMLTSSQLTRILEQAVENYMPPLRAGKRIKLRFAHPGGVNPPVIVVHGNQTRYLSDSYKRYMINFFRQKLQLTGTPIRLQLRTTENPYAGRKNISGPRQNKKRHRLLRYSKRNRHEHDNY